MSRIEFDLPLWSATIYHSERGADNPWNRVFNIAEVEDEEENRKAAVETAVELFSRDGMSPITIYRIEVAPLIPLGGGEHGSD